MTKVNNMKGRSPVKIPLHSVMDILSEVDRLGHSKTFQESMKNSKAYVTIHPKTVNAVKNYLADQKLDAHSAVAQQVMGACPTSDPYTCPYHDSTL